MSGFDLGELIKSEMRYRGILGVVVERDSQGQVEMRRKKKEKNYTTLVKMYIFISLRQQLGKSGGKMD